MLPQLHAAEASVDHHLARGSRFPTLPQDVCDDGQCRQNQLRLHVLVHVMQPRHCNSTSEPATSAGLGI